MTSDRKPELDQNTMPDLSAAYRELFAEIQPSEQLLTATRRLYARPRRQRWPAAAALCCAAACLLLTVGLQLWPQPGDIAPPENSMQMRMAAETQPDAYAEPQGRSRMSVQEDKNAELSIASTETSTEALIEAYNEDNQDTEVGIALLSDDTPEASVYSPEIDCLDQNTVIIEPLHIAQIVFRSLKWLVLW